MKQLNLTNAVRIVLQRDPRAQFDELHLLLCVFEAHGLKLTPEQKVSVSAMPNPKSVMRIADREKKRLCKGGKIA